ncbi:hypothetical protein SNEBB_004844 [Seison nebaliae]|nr:hypothetical protein SNEBB_004844 [Seison nebaliae]
MSYRDVANEPITYIGGRPLGNRNGVLKTNKEIATAQRSGQLDSNRKFNAGGNTQHNTGMNASKLDNETDVQRHKHVAKDVAQTIAKVRTQLGMTQKELATKCNEKPTVIHSYESGSAIPNVQVLCKMERILKVKLRGKDIGTPFASKKK